MVKKSNSTLSCSHDKSVFAPYATSDRAFFVGGGQARLSSTGRTVETKRGKEKSREPMLQRKGRVLELMNVRRAIREIECMRAFVGLEFDDMLELQEAMVACLEENLGECREEEKELLAWWSPRVTMANEARWIDGFAEDDL